MTTFLAQFVDHEPEILRRLERLFADRFNRTTTKLLATYTGTSTTLDASFQQDFLQFQLEKVNGHHMVKFNRRTHACTTTECVW